MGQNRSLEPHVFALSRTLPGEEPHFSTRPSHKGWWSSLSCLIRRPFPLHLAP